MGKAIRIRAEQNEHGWQIVIDTPLGPFWNPMPDEQSAKFVELACNSRDQLVEAIQLFMTAFHGTDPDAIQNSDPETAAALRAGRAALTAAGAKQ